MKTTEELRAPGLRLRHPPWARVDTRELETRSHRVRRIRVRSPWLQSGDDPSEVQRFELRIVVFENPDGSPVGDLLDQGRVRARPGRFSLAPGTLGGREATLRRPADPARDPRGAYVVGPSRFFFVEWKGPAGPILETLELEPEDGGE